MRSALIVGKPPVGSAWILKAHTATGAQNQPATPAITTTGANLIVIAVGMYSNAYGNLGAPAVSDNKGNTYQANGASVASGEPLLQTFYCASPVVGAGHIFYVGPNGGTIYAAVAVAAFSGAIATPLDAFNAAAAAGSTTTSGSITPAHNNELLITCAGSTGAGSVISSVSDGFAIIDTVNYSSGVYEGVGLAYKIQSTAAAINPTWVATGSPNTVANITSFRSS
jgi:hypothetical protein